MEVLEGEALQQAVSSLPGWGLEDGVLVMTASFRDFVAAMGFVNLVAEQAEAEGHHPDMDIRYNKVRVALVTHDAGGVTELDLKLAAKVSGLLTA